MLALTLLTALACTHLAAAPLHAREAGHALHHAAPTPGTPDAKRIALAAKVRDTLLSAGYLQVNARIIHQGKELLVRSDMTPDKLRVEAFRDNTLIAAFAINGDRVQEYIPLHTPTEGDLEYRNVIVEFDKLDVVEKAVSVGSAMILDSDTACEFGTLMVSWLDLRTDRAEWWSDCILEGKQLEDQTIGDARCLVFHESVSFPMDDGAGEITFTHTVYINPETSLPVRWDTSQSTSEYRMIRERYYEFVRAAHAPLNMSWTLDVKQLKNAVPPANAPSVAARSTP